MANFLARHWKTLAVTSISITSAYFCSHSDHSPLIHPLSSLCTVRAAEYERRNTSKAFLNNRKTQQKRLLDDEDDDEEDEDESDGLSRNDASITNLREKRFRDFASLEYQGEVYMTPVDLLESIIDEQPRPRIGRRQLTDEQVAAMLYNTPAKHRGSKKFFRNLEDSGLISFAEYSFLWVTLTEPTTQFQIAFDMIDIDGNQLVDRHEFLVLEKALSGKQLSRQSALKQTSSSKKQSPSGSPLLSLQSTDKPATTLLLHFFGKNGRDTLNYTEFKRFMENFQLEVLEIEFKEFSRGFKNISDLDFAEILLRYTNFDRESKKLILKKVRKSTDQEKSITFEQFTQFFHFLNNLDEFNIVMRFHQLSDKPISQAEFQRAVRISSGFQLDAHTISLIFRMFDADDDQHLSYDEFMFVMKDRLSRGFETSEYNESNSSKFEQYKRCIRDRSKYASVIPLN